jgi:hypothetical protein
MAIPETMESLEFGFQHGPIKKGKKITMHIYMSICIGLQHPKMNQMSSVLCLTISEDQPNTREGDSVPPIQDH